MLLSRLNVSRTMASVKGLGRCPAPELGIGHAAIKLQRIHLCQRFFNQSLALSDSLRAAFFFTLSLRRCLLNKRSTQTCYELSRFLLRDHESSSPPECFSKVWRGYIKLKSFKLEETDMQTYWANLRTTSGGDFIRVTVQAPNPFVATEMLKAMYGDRLMSDFASLLA